MKFATSGTASMMASMAVSMVVAGLMLAPAPVRAQSVEAGGKIFRKCAACHQIGAGAKNRTGPILTGVVGRPAGAVAGYKYSKSMRALAAGGQVWSEEAIFAWLQNPTRFMRAKLGDPRAKAKMNFKLKNAADRRNVIAYLATFSAPGPAARSPTPAVPPTATATATAADSPATSPARSRGICVVNSAPTAHVFTVESTSGQRRMQTLSPGQSLCVDSAGAGTVAVFLSETEIEGCTRIAQKDQPETLLHYYPFDRCAWVGNSN